MSQLIVVKQLPVIEEQLRTLAAEISNRTEQAMSLACTEDTVKEVKAVRAAMNKEFSELEDQRKAVKAAVLGPYEQFEAVYKECVATAYKTADAALKERIDGVQGTLRAEKELRVAEYFREYATAQGMEWLNFCDCGPNVTLSASEKKLKEEAKQTIDRIAQDMAVISSMDNAEEITAEFKGTLDAAKAIAIVQDRHRRIEAERAAKAAREEAEKVQAQAVARVEAVAPAVEIVPPVQEPVYRCNFSVAGTKAQLKRLKEFMNAEGIQYE